MIRINNEIPIERLIEKIKKLEKLILSNAQTTNRNFSLMKKEIEQLKK